MKRLFAPLLSVFLLTGHAGGADVTSEALFKEANDKFMASDFVGALERFKAVYARTKSAAALLGIATTLKELGRFAEAADAYDGYLADPKANPAKRTDAEKALAEALEKIATLRIDAEPGARVTVDARDARDKMRVDAGPHVLVADDGSGAPVTVQVSVSAGEERMVSLRRKTESPPPSAAPTSPPALSSSSSRKPLAYGLIIGGVAIGGVFGALALSQRSGSHGTWNTYAWIADGGGLAALVGVVLLATTPSESSTSGFVVTPSLGRHDGSISIRRTW